MKNIKRLFFLAVLIVLAFKILSSDFDKLKNKNNTEIAVVINN